MAKKEVKAATKKTTAKPKAASPAKKAAPRSPGRGKPEAAEESSAQKLARSEGWPHARQDDPALIASVLRPPLEWKEVSSTEWRATQDDGRFARITMRTGQHMNVQPSFYCYVDSDSTYLGHEHDLEHAKIRVVDRRRDARALWHELPGGYPAFLAVSDEGRRAAWAEFEKTKKAEQRNTPEAKQAEAIRRGIQAEQEVQKVARQQSKKSKEAAAVLSETAVIKILTEGNPRKPGTGAHARFEKLREFNGKTVGAYAAAGGNLETLTNAIKDKRAAAE